MLKFTFEVGDVQSPLSFDKEVVEFIDDEESAVELAKILSKKLSSVIRVMVFDTTTDTYVARLSFANGFQVESAKLSDMVALQVAIQEFALTGSASGQSAFVAPLVLVSALLVAIFVSLAILAIKKALWAALVVTLCMGPFIVIALIYEIKRWMK